MGRKVNVVLPSGRIVSVDEDVAAAGQLSRDTTGRVTEGLDEINEERSSGVLEGLKAAGEGLADTASLGLYGAVRNQLDPEYGRNAGIRAEERAGSRFIGEAAGYLIPVAGEATAAGKVGAAVGKFTAPGIARAAGTAIAESGVRGAAHLGRAAEGAILGVGAEVARTNVTGDPFTIEAAVESAGIGGLLDVGLGAAGDRLESAAWSAKKTRAELEFAERGRQLFTEPPASWNEFVESHAAAAARVKAFNKEVEKEATAYAKFTGNNAKVSDAISEAQDLVNHIRDDRYARRAGAFEGTPKKVGYTMDPEGKVTGLENTYEGGKVGFGFKGEGEGSVKIPGREGGMRPTRGEEAYVRRVEQTIDSRPVISEDMISRLNTYNARISNAEKLKGGGWSRNGRGHWVPDPAAPPNPTAALEEARALRGDLEREFPMASGEYLRTQLPPTPRQAIPEIRGAVPKSLDEFSRKHATSVAEIAESLDPVSADALSRVMRELDLAPKGSPAEGLAALHGTLGTYRSTLAKYAGKDVAAESPSFLLRMLNKAARYSAARYVDAGGTIGAVKRTVAGEAVGRAMTAAEGAVLGYAIGGDPGDAALGAALMSSRLGLRARVRTMVDKYGIPAANAARELGPVTAYLANRFPSGQKDEETDHRRLAVNRINDLHAAAVNGDNAAFLAVQGMLGAPDDVAWKMHRQIVGTLQHLVSVLPRDNGLNGTMFGSNWTPQWHESVALAHRLEAVHAPLDAIARAIAGDGHPAAVETLWAVFPSLMSELATEVSIAAPQLKDLTYQQASAYSALFRTPLTALQQPVVVTTIQGMYLPKPPPAPTTNGGGGANKPAKPPGRPAAVQSPVAGSSPEALTRN